MKNSKTKVSPPQSMESLGEELLTYCKSEEATKEDIDTIIAELEDMKIMLENYKKTNQ